MVGGAGVQPSVRLAGSEGTLRVHRPEPGPRVTEGTNSVRERKSRKNPANIESHLVIAGNDPGLDMVALASSIISADVFDWET